jgi:hypothetical protein
MTVAKKPNLILAQKEGVQFSVGASGTDPSRLFLIKGHLHFQSCGHRWEQTRQCCGWVLLSSLDCA